MSLPYFENEPVIHRECIDMHEKVLLYANELVLLGK